MENEPILAGLKQNGTENPTARTSYGTIAGDVGDPDTDESILVGEDARKQARTSHIQFASLCWCFIVLGWNDASTGPLLPRIQAVYNVGYLTVSFLFVFLCLGSVLGSLTNVFLTEKLGLGKTIVLGAVLQASGNCVQASAPKFPVLVSAFLVAGIGRALVDAQTNGYVAAYKKNPETRMGVLHATYGLGALISPLVATQFAQLEHWSFHYLVSLGMAIINIIFLSSIFRFKSQDECLAQTGQSARKKGSGDKSSIRQILSLRAVHLLAFFILIYVGVEVTIGGWIVTYIIKVRGGGPTSGYISSGFFTGLTLGRVSLLWFNKKVGERRALWVYALLAIGLEFVVWCVPSLIGGAIAISFVGLLLGPMYPIIMNQAGRILPQWLVTGSIGWISGFGATGSAAIPFIVGFISTQYGIESLPPFLIVMTILMAAIWALVPKPPVHRTD